jgi:hypothetical protein
MRVSNEATLFLKSADGSQIGCFLVSKNLHAAVGSPEQVCTTTE